MVQSAAKLKQWTLAFAGGLALVSIGVLAQAPSPPSSTTACAGVTVLVNGSAIGCGNTLNIVPGLGVTPQISPNPAIGGINLTFAADAAYMQTLSNDQAGADHVLNAISQNCNNCVPSKAYTASLNPAIAQYNTGSWYIMLPDLTSLPGATVSIGGLGPIALNGICNAGTGCILVAIGSPVNTFAVH
jgi:hypothetical protein